MTIGTERAALRPWIGWASLAAVVGSLAVMIGMTTTVVIQMLKPTAFFADLTQQYLHDAARSPDRTTVDLAIILEYANADIRTSAIQIAFSLIAGVFFAIVGVLLFCAGFTGAIQAVAKQEKFEVDLRATAPGAVCAILGAVIIVVGVGKNVSRPLGAQVDRPTGFHIRTESVKPVSANEGEGIPTDIKRDRDH